MDTETKQYELGFHLMPELEGVELLTATGEVEKIITKNGGKTIKAREPRKQHLSYPIQLKHYGHFGVFEFESAPDMLAKINADLKMNSDVLRYILIHGYGDAKVFRSLTPRRGRPKPKADEKTEAAKADKDSQVPAGEMEKQLEDVIGNL